MIYPASKITDSAVACSCFSKAYTKTVHSAKLLAKIVENTRH